MSNKNLFKKAAVRALPATALVLALSYCTVDERYSYENIKNVNTDVTLFENGLSVPLVESTAKITIDSLVRASGLDTTEFGQYLKVGEDGNYYIVYESSLSLDDAIKDLDLKNLVQLDAVNYSQELSYKLGDISGSSLKTTAESLEYSTNLESFNLNLNFEPLSEDITFLQAEYLHTLATAAEALGQSSFTIPSDLSLAQNSSQKLPAFTLPSQVKSLKSANLKPGAAIVIEFTADDPIFSAGSIVPDIKVDLSDVLVLADGTSTLDISSLELNKANNYSASKSFAIKSLTTTKFTEEKNIPFNGTIRQNGLVAETAKAQANTKGLNVSIKVNFVNVELDEVIGEIKEYVMECNVEPKSIAYEMPEAIGNFGTFSIIPKGAPSVSVNIDIPELNDLNLVTEGIVIHIPEFVKFENVPAIFAYDEAASTFTITKIEKGNWNIPIKELEITPKKVDAGYIVEGSYSANGQIAIPEGEIDLTKLLALSGKHVGINVSVPEIEAESIALKELAIDVDESADFDLIAAKDIPEMILKVGAVDLNNVKAQLDIELGNLPEIGDGKFLLNLNIAMPDFIKPSEINIAEEVSNGTLSKSIDIEGIDLSAYDLAALKAEGKDLKGSVRVLGKVSAENPTVDLSSLNADITGRIALKIADENNKIEISRIAARVDYQLDTLFKYKFGALPEELKDCVLELPEADLIANIHSNLAMPLNATLDIKNVAEGYKVNFPYSENPEEISTISNEYKININNLINSHDENLELTLKAQVDKTKDVIVYPDADYKLDIDFNLSAPVQLGEETHITYADTLDLQDSAATLAEVLKATKAQLYGSIESTLPFTVSVKVNLLAYDKESDTYGTIDTKPIEAVIAKAGETNDFTLLLEKAENASVEGLSHIRFSVDLQANGANAKEDDYIQISKLGVTVPEGISLNIKDLTSKDE